MNKFIFILFSVLFFGLSASESNSFDRPLTMIALEMNYKQNETRVNDWFEEIDKGSDGKGVSYMIQRLVEDETPEFVSSLAYIFDHLGHDDEVTEIDRVEHCVMSLTLYQWAGQKGYGPAMTRASVLFEEAGDHANSIIWEKQGVEAGDSLATLNHGIRLIVGLEFDGITEQNPVEGWKWIFIAKELGEKNADKCIKNGFGSPLSAIIQGKAKARDWIQKHPGTFKQQY